MATAADKNRSIPMRDHVTEIRAIPTTDVVALPKGVGIGLPQAFNLSKAQRGIECI